MRKAIAFGLFIISTFMGASLVIAGAVLTIETFVWAGMLLIALGILNLAVKMAFPEHKEPVQLIIERPKRLRVVKRKTRRKTVKRKVTKRTVKKKKTTRRKATKRKAKRPAKKKKRTRKR